MALNNGFRDIDSGRNRFLGPRTVTRTDLEAEGEHRDAEAALKRIHKRPQGCTALSVGQTMTSLIFVSHHVDRHLGELSRQTSSEAT